MEDCSEHSRMFIRGWRRSAMGDFGKFGLMI